MTSGTREHTLGDFARAGFQQLSEAKTALLGLSASVNQPPAVLLDACVLAADPDAALDRLIELDSMHPSLLSGVNPQQWRMITLLFGASPAIATFFVRHPERFRSILDTGGRLVTQAEATRELLQAVGANTTGMPVADIAGDDAHTALRVRYRELLAETMLFDLSRGVVGDAADHFGEVATALSDLATAALESALAIARAHLASGIGGSPVAPADIAATRLAVIAMGKCGARELNVVSDVDVMFIADPADNLDAESAVRIGTRLATETMNAIHQHGAEPPLWQVDPNLRPEGKQGALVRSLSSMLNYYDRWAKTWEFQALLKARPAAGDLELGKEFVHHTRELVWASASREDFVGNVQRMRERVTEHIDPSELDIQIKLGPGGLRDIEFSVQLLQLVHGQHEPQLHAAGTLPALTELVDGGYVARDDGNRLADHYRRLRVLEHRLQMQELRRTALMPRDEERLRILARSSRFATSATDLFAMWQHIKHEVRELHLKIFYAPLLTAVAALPNEELLLDNDKARARLEGFGFRDPDGALRHLAALTKGSSRTARIQRNLLPVLLQWLADGTDPDFGLLAFRRVSEANRTTPWYLRLLRDGAEAAERLTRVLSSSRFAAELLESIPEAVAWLENDKLLQPPHVETLREEMNALASRRSTLDDAADALRAVHRREVLRLALGRLVFVLNDSDVSAGLDAAHSALLESLLAAILADEKRQQISDEQANVDLDIALIAMGRFGGRELGFASDIDLIAVYRSSDPQHADQQLKRATKVVSELQRLVSDPKFTVDLDFDLRPEGKNGPLVRSLDAYRSYYQRWSVTWESQALIRARHVAGSHDLGSDFILLANQIRYPNQFDETQVREVRRIKARVEAERLPRGANPRLHLKLGPGGISDVEWLVQLLQLQHAHAIPELQTESTLEALRVLEESQLLTPESREVLERSWVLASKIRSAVKLWSDRSIDILPSSRSELEGIAGVLGMPSGHTTELEEEWFSASRRARQVFEAEFFGFENTSFLG